MPWHWNTIFGFEDGQEVNCKTVVDEPCHKKAKVSAQVSVDETDAIYLVTFPEEPHDASKNFISRTQKAHCVRNLCRISSICIAVSEATIEGKRWPNKVSLRCSVRVQALHSNRHQHSKKNDNKDNNCVKGQETESSVQTTNNGREIWEHLLMAFRLVLKKAEAKNANAIWTWPQRKKRMM